VSPEPDIRPKIVLIGRLVVAIVNPVQSSPRTAHVQSPCAAPVEKISGNGTFPSAPHVSIFRTKHFRFSCPFGSSPLGESFVSG
jgi:hypothetical protein